MSTATDNARSALLAAETKLIGTARAATNIWRNRKLLGSEHVDRIMRDLAAASAEQIKAQDALLASHDADQAQRDATELRTQERGLLLAGGGL